MRSLQGGKHTEEEQKPAKNSNLATFSVELNNEEGRITQLIFYVLLTSQDQAGPLL